MRRLVPFSYSFVIKLQILICNSNNHIKNVAIVTSAGASSGIGLETTRVLAKRGVHVVMGIRDMPAGERARQVIMKDNPSAKVDAIRLDLSSMESVRSFASEFTSSGLPLNILM